jgi:hypothetical protein
MRIRTITPQQRDDFKRERLEDKAKLTLAFQLGYYIGEEIVHRFLPTLSVDDIRTNNNISVTCGEGDECRRLNNVWWSKISSLRNVSDDEKTNATEEEWKALRAYHEMLEEKYLPKTVKCRFSLINVLEEDILEFKRGIGVSLWDSDCSHYSTDVENINIADDEDLLFTVITIKIVK